MSCHKSVLHVTFVIGLIKRSPFSYNRQTRQRRPLKQRRRKLPLPRLRRMLVRKSPLICVYLSGIWISSSRIPLGYRRWRTLSSNAVSFLFSLILHRFHFNITAARKAEAAAKAAAQKEADGMYFIMISQYLDCFFMSSNHLFTFITYQPPLPLRERKKPPQERLLNHLLMKRRVSLIYDGVLCIRSDRWFIKLTKTCTHLLDSRCRRQEGRSCQGCWSKEGWECCQEGRSRQGRRVEEGWRWWV